MSDAKPTPESITQGTKALAQCGQTAAETGAAAVAAMAALRREAERLGRETAESFQALADAANAFREARR